MLCIVFKEEGRPRLSGACMTASWACSQVLSLPVSCLQLKVRREQRDKQQLPWRSGGGEGEDEEQDEEEEECYV